MWERLFDRWVEWMKRRGSYRMIKIAQDGRHGSGEKVNYLGRFFLFRIHRVCGVFLHCFYSSDPEGVHDHPWPSGGIILKGGYYEQRHDGTIHWRGPGTIRWYRPANELHRVILEHPHSGGEVWTIFWYGKRCRDWGWLEKDGTWTRSADNDFVAKEPLIGRIFPHAKNIADEWADA